MKQLTLIRHAKSSWAHKVIDHERPLLERGINDAILVANYLKGKLKTPDVIWSSTANRALSTAKLFIQELEYQKIPFQTNSNLYDFEGLQVTQALKNASNLIQHVLLFGHNYAITNIANVYGNYDYANIPTAGVVQLEFAIKNWKDLETGTTVFSIFPKELKQD